MRISLETTGSHALLERLAPFIPDEFINDLVPAQVGRGRRRHWSPAQLYRLLLLTLLTPAHSCNLMLELLDQERAWRKFARLPNRYRLPVASQLHDFRTAMGIGGLRRQYLGSEQLNFSPWLSGPLFALLQQHHSVKADWIRCGRIRRKGWSIRCSDNAAEADPDASIEIGFVLDLVILSWSCGPA